MDGHNVLRTGRPLLLGLDIFRSLDSRKCFISHSNCTASAICKT